MRPRLPRDPTVLLVLGLVLVVGVLLATRALVGGSGTGEVSVTSGTDTPSTTPTVDSSPSDLPAPREPREPRSTRTPRSKPTGPPDLGVKRTGKRVCVPTDEDVDFTVVSYNIKSGYLSSAAAIAAYLRSVDADIVLLQEVDQLRYSSGRVDQPAYFGEQLDMPYAFGENVPHADGGSYGTVVLSRFPLLSAENTFLPQPPGTQRRGLLHVVVDVDDTEVSIYNTHLQNADPNARILQADAISGLVADDPRPRILGGDLNTPPGSPPVNTLAGAWVDTWTQVGVGAGRTAPAGIPRARIDYLLYGGDGLVPTAAEVLSTGLSDHRPVRAAYRLAAVGEPVCFRRLG